MEKQTFIVLARIPVQAKTKDEAVRIATDNLPTALPIAPLVDTDVLDEHVHYDELQRQAIAGQIKLYLEEKKYENVNPANIESMTNGVMEWLHGALQDAISDAATSFIE